VVVPRASAAQTAQASQARVAKEEKTREKLRAGELGLDYYGLRAKLKELGVEFVEE
jgi:4-hydroxy-4-methyl-2-oxoglutarate aldolase